MVVTVDCQETMPMPELLAKMTGREGEIMLGFREKMEDKNTKIQPTKDPAPHIRSPFLKKRDSCTI